MKSPSIRETVPGKMMQFYTELFPDIWIRMAETRKRFYAQKPWPDWCDTPYGVYADVIANMLSKEDVKEILNTPVDSRENKKVEYLNFLCPTVGALYVWNKTKNIYKFDKTLSEELATTTFDGNIPARILLRLPDWCTFIDVSDSPIEGHAGFFVLPDYDEHRKRSDLFILPLSKNTENLCAPFCIDLEDITLEESIIRGYELLYNKKRNEITEVIKKDVDHTVRLLIPFLHHILYLCSEEPDICNHNPYSTRVKPVRASMQSVNQWDIGIRVAAKLIHSEGQGKPHIVGERHRPRPHVRRAHWHHFWTGPRKEERTLIVKWLHPSLVNTSDADQLPKVIREVEKNV